MSIDFTALDEQFNDLPILGPITSAMSVRASRSWMKPAGITSAV